MMLPRNVVRGYRHINMLTESDTEDEEELLFESKNHKDGESNGTVAAFPLQIRHKHSGRSSCASREGSTTT